MRISHEAIYQVLSVQGHGALRRERPPVYAPAGRRACPGHARKGGARGWSAPRS